MGKRTTPALNGFEEHFAQNYIIDFCGARAARAAGSTADRPDQVAYALLRRIEVRSRVDALIRERRERLHLSQDRAVLALAELAFADPRNIADWGDDGLTLKESASLDPEYARTIKSVRRVKKLGATNEDTTEFVMHDKLKALELLGKHLGMWRDDDAGKNKPAVINLVMPFIPDPDSGRGAGPEDSGELEAD